MGLNGAKIEEEEQEEEEKKASIDVSTNTRFFSTT